METKTIPCITIEDLKQDSHLIEYVDDNLIILDNIGVSYTSKTPVKLDCFMLVFCIEGKVDTYINNKQQVLEADYCAVLLPNTIIRQIIQTSSCNVRIVAFSSEFIKIAIKKETWDIGHYLYYNPIFPIKRNSSYKLYLYKELALTCICEKKHPYSKEAMKHLYASIFCELLAALYDNIPAQKGISNYRNDRSMYIFRRFIEMVSDDDGSHRSVSYYADQLCYSPKHLSTVVKKICGKGPLTIINEHAMECIKFELKHSEKSIKEIADRFNFANPSFFGKFVRQHIGMSPLQYRIQEEEKNTEQA